MIEIPGRRVDWFTTLDSTMLEARRNPEAGRIVVADEQTAGMGRHGRAWHSAAGEGLYVTFVLKAKPVPVMMLALGLAVRDVIGPQADLRWPNDVLLRECKCAGILAQAEGSIVLAGIGINVSQRRFPDGLDTPATSLALEGIPATREDLLVALAPAIDRMIALPHDEVLRQFAAASSYVSGKRVHAEDIEGVTCGLDASGFLQVREDNGTVRTLFSGGVRPV